MFEVYCLTQDLVIMKAESENQKAFQTEDEAWDFINSVMTSRAHPRFMWMRKVKHADT